MPVRLPPGFRPVEIDRFHLGGALTGQFVLGHGHLFFPVAGMGISVHPVRAVDRKMVIPIPANERVQAVAVSEELLLIAGSGGLRAVSLLPLLVERELEMSQWLTHRVMEGYGPTLLVVEAHGLAVVSTPDTIYGFSLGREGQIAWSRPREGHGAVMFAYVAGLVVVVEQSGKVWAVDPASGEVRWRQNLLEEVSIRPGIAAWEGRLYLFTGDRLWMVLVEHGKVMQTASTFPDAKGLACAGSLVFLVGNDGAFRVSPMETAPVCVSEQAYGVAPLVTEGLLIGGTMHGSVCLMDPRAHFPRDQPVRGTDDFIFTTPLWVGDRLVMASHTGEVVLYQHNGGGERA